MGRKKSFSRTFNLFLKRIMDIIASGLGLIILSPLFLIVSLLVKKEDSGPIFFRQKRLGLNGKVFEIHKFRTMVMNAEKMGSGLRVSDDSDSRITRIGHFLRKTSIDELAQLIDVFKGDMSLVGPRPPVTYHPYNGYEGYPDEFKLRFDMKPGMTGLAQIKVRNSVSWDERIKIDLEYVEKFNVLFDIKILFMTIPSVLGSKNIY